MEKQELFTIPEAVINFFGLRAEDWLRPYGFGDETYYCFEGDTLALAMEQQLISDTKKVKSEYACYLGGVRATNPFNAYEVIEVKFPKLAFYNWWREDHRGLEAPKWFDDFLSDTGLQEASAHSPNNVSNEVEIEVIEGLTVGELRSYLKEDSPEYLPRLLAVLMAKKAVIQKRNLTDKDGFRKYGTRRNSLKALAEEEVKKALEGVGIEKSVTLDTTSVARILVKEKYPNNGTGGSY